MKSASLILMLTFLIFGCTQQVTEKDPYKSASLTRNWTVLYDTCYQTDSLLQYPRTAALMGFAASMLNKSNEAHALFQYLNADTVRIRGWLQWAGDFQKQYPRQAIANFYLGDAYMRVHDYNNALKYFNKSLDIDPDMPLALNARGNYYGLFNEKEKALTDFNRLNQQFPDIADFLISRGTFKYNNKSPEGALTDFENALKTAPNSVLALNGKACALLFDTQNNLSVENQLDSISLCLAKASFIFNSPVFQSNTRNLTLEIENRLYPELKNDPLFRVSDFLDWKTLKTISDKNEHDILRLITKSKLPDYINEEFLIKLNKALFNAKLFTSLLLDNELSDSVKKVISDKYSKSVGPQYNNRILLEELYMGLIAGYKFRNPGMQITSRGLVTADEYRRPMTSDQIQDAQNRNDYLWKPMARAAQAIPWVGPAIGNNWEAHLDQASEANNRALQSRGVDMAKTNPGGALADIKRSVVDGNEPYFLVCPNAMGYEKK